MKKLPLVLSLHCIVFLPFLLHLDHKCSSIKLWLITTKPSSVWSRLSQFFSTNFPLRNFSVIFFPQLSLPWNFNTTDTHICFCSLALWRAMNHFNSWVTLSSPHPQSSKTNFHLLGGNITLVEYIWFRAISQPQCYWQIILCCRVLSCAL